MNPISLLWEAASAIGVSPLAMIALALILVGYLVAKVIL